VSQDIVVLNVEVGNETKVGHENHGALLVYDGENTYWIPKSVIIDRDLDKNDIGTLTVSLKWAIDNGAI